MNKTLHSMFTGIATIAYALICSVSAQAIPLFDVSFTGDTAGVVPSTAPATGGGVSTKPTFAVPAEELFGTSVFVQNTYTDSLTGNVFGDGNVVVLSDGNDGVATSVLFQGVPTDEMSTGVFTVSLDWMQDTGPATSSGFIGLTNQTRGQNLSALFLDLEHNAGNIRSGNSVNFGATLGTAPKGVAHHLDWVVDLSQPNFEIATEVYLDGALLAVQQREPIGGPHDGASAFGSMALSTAAPAIGVLAFDNIQIRAGRHVIVDDSLPGDYNNNGTVDAADYVVWRDNVDSSNVLPNDPIGGSIGSLQYNQWRSNFGKVIGSVSLVAGQVAEVPEPRSVLLLLMGLAGLLSFRRGVGSSFFRFPGA